MLLLGAATGEEAIAVRVMEEVELAAAGWLLRRLTGRRAATGRRSVPPLRSLSTKKQTLTVRLSIYLSVNLSIYILFIYLSIYPYLY